ncbi:OmpA family protein [Bacteroides sp. GM023]|uniref:OmpA family protein n=1 Tax=Bacteroides sp. GM023 TaxID=2723058 RepID=UPI00168B3ABE|nr:OmpA family protein [Bacteroides sp. GM023]MBD3590249.1 OmpA family protein [Bacteroides sp. GM023]
MKKGLLFILLAAVSVCLPAQEKEKAAKSYRVETNTFGANWFISGGVGAQMYFGDNDSKAGFGDRISPALDIAVGKWFTPGIGLRIAYNGLQAKGATPNANDVYAKGGTFSNGYYKQKWNVANFHGDVLLNLSNMFCGYNEERVYSFIPYVGAGLVHSWSKPTENNLGINAGLINRFRLSPALDLNVELRGLLMKDAFGGKSKEAMGGVTVGVTYKFKKRSWDAVPTVPMVPESQLNDLRDRVNSLKGENESLKRDLVEARNKKPEVIVKKEAGFVPRLVVVFNIGKSNISKREYMNIEAMAKGIKENPNKVFTVTGYADKGTGSAEYNMKLSKKRAESVRDLMVNEFGVPASQLKVDYKGGVSNMFYDDAKLSRVAIVEE